MLLTDKIIRPGGLEPPTSGSAGQRSGPLSYGRIHGAIVASQEALVNREIHRPLPPTPQGRLSRKKHVRCHSQAVRAYQPRAGRRELAGPFDKGASRQVGPNSGEQVNTERVLIRNTARNHHVPVVMAADDAERRRVQAGVGRFVELLEFGQYLFNRAFRHSDKFRVRFGIVWNYHQCLV